MSDASSRTSRERDGAAGNEQNDPADLGELADTSSKLLSEIRALREAEERKRRTSISTPEFHRLAREVEQRALDVWATASTERTESSDLQTQPGTTTEDADALRNGDRPGERETVERESIEREAVEPEAAGRKPDAATRHRTDA